MSLDISLFNNSAALLLLVPLAIWAWFIAGINSEDEDEFSRDLAAQPRAKGAPGARLGRK